MRWALPGYREESGLELMGKLGVCECTRAVLGDPARTFLTCAIGKGQSGRGLDKWRGALASADRAG